MDWQLRMNPFDGLLHSPGCFEVWHGLAWICRHTDASSVVPFYLSAGLWRVNARTTRTHTHTRNDNNNCSIDSSRAPPAAWNRLSIYLPFVLSHQPFEIGVSGNNTSLIWWNPRTSESCVEMQWRMFVGFEYRPLVPVQFYATRIVSNELSANWKDFLENSIWG